MGVQNIATAVAYLRGFALGSTRPYANAPAFVLVGFLCIPQLDMTFIQSSSLFFGDALAAAVELLTTKPKAKLYEVLLKMPDNVDDVHKLLRHYTTNAGFRSVVKDMFIAPRTHFVETIEHPDAVPRVLSIAKNRANTKRTEGDSYWEIFYPAPATVPSPPAPVPAPAPASDTVACPACTFANTLGARKCAICGTQIPLAGAGSSKPSPVFVPFVPAKPVKSKPRPVMPKLKPKPKLKTLVRGDSVSDNMSLSDINKLFAGQLSSGASDILELPNEPLLSADLAKGLRGFKNVSNISCDARPAIPAPVAPSGPSMFVGTLDDSAESIMKIYLGSPVESCRRLFDLATESSQAMTLRPPNQLYTPPINSSMTCFVNTLFWNFVSPSFIPILASLFATSPLVNLKNRAAAFQLLDGMTHLVRGDNIQEPFDVYRGNYLQFGGIMESGARRAPGSRLGSTGDSKEQQDAMSQAANPHNVPIQTHISINQQTAVYTTGDSFKIVAQVLGPDTPDPPGAPFRAHAALSAMFDKSLDVEASMVRDAPGNLAGRRRTMFHSMVTSPFMLQPLTLINMQLTTATGAFILNDVTALDPASMGYRSLRASVVTENRVPKRSGPKMALNTWVNNVTNMADQAESSMVASAVGAASASAVGAASAATPASVPGLPPAIPPIAGAVPTVPVIKIREVDSELNAPDDVFVNSFLKGTLQHQPIRAILTSNARVHGTFMREIVSSAIEGIIDPTKGEVRAGRPVGGLFSGTPKRAALPRVAQAGKYLASIRNQLYPVYGDAWIDMIRPYSSKFDEYAARGHLDVPPGPYEIAMARNGFTNTIMMSVTMAQLSSPVLCNVGAREGPSHGNDMVFNRVPHAALNLVKLISGGGYPAVAKAAKYWRTKLEYWKHNRDLPDRWNGDDNDVSGFEIHPDAEALLLKAASVVNSTNGYTQALGVNAIELRDPNLKRGLVSIYNEYAAIEAQVQGGAPRRVKAYDCANNRMNFHIQSLSGESALLMQTNVSLQWLSLKNALGCRVGPNGSADMVARFGLGASCGFTWLAPDLASAVTGIAPPPAPVLVQACTLPAPGEGDALPYKMYIWVTIDGYSDAESADYSNAFRAAVADKLDIIWPMLYGNDLDSPIISHAYSCTLVGDEDRRVYDVDIIKTKVQVMDAAATETFLSRAFAWSINSDWKPTIGVSYLPIEPRHPEIPDSMTLLVDQPSGTIDELEGIDLRGYSNKSEPIQFQDSSALAKTRRVRMVQTSHGVPDGHRRVYRPYEHRDASFVMRGTTAEGFHFTLDAEVVNQKVPKYPAVYADDVRGVQEVACKRFSSSNVNFNGTMETAVTPPHGPPYVGPKPPSFNQNVNFLRLLPMAPVQAVDEPHTAPEHQRVIEYPCTNWTIATGAGAGAASAAPAPHAQEVRWYKNMIGSVLDLWISDSTLGSIPTRDRLGNVSYSMLLTADEGSANYRWIVNTVLKDITGTILALAGFPMIYDRHGQPCVASLRRNAAYAEMFDSYLPRDENASGAKLYLGNILNDLATFLKDLKATRPMLVMPYERAVLALHHSIPAAWKPRLASKEPGQIDLIKADLIDRYPLCDEYAHNGNAGQEDASRNHISTNPDDVIRANPGAEPPIFMKAVRITYAKVEPGSVGHYYAYAKFGDQWFRIDTIKTAKMVPVATREIAEILNRVYSNHSGVVTYRICKANGEAYLGTSWTDRVQFLSRQSQAIQAHMAKVHSIAIPDMLSTIPHVDALVSGSSQPDLQTLVSPPDSQTWAFSAVRNTRPMFMVLSDNVPHPDYGKDYTIGASPYQRLINAVRVFRWMLSGAPTPLGPLPNEACEVYKALILHLCYGASQGVVIESMLGSRLRNIYPPQTALQWDTPAASMTSILSAIPSAQPAFKLLSLKRDISSKGAVTSMDFGTSTRGGGSSDTGLEAQARMQAIVLKRKAVLELMDSLKALDVTNPDAIKAFGEDSGMNLSSPGSKWWDAFHARGERLPPVLVGRLYEPWLFPHTLASWTDDAQPISGPFAVSSLLQYSMKRSIMARIMRMVLTATVPPSDYGNEGFTVVLQTKDVDGLKEILEATGGPEYVATFVNTILKNLASASPETFMPVIAVPSLEAAQAPVPVPTIPDEIDLTEL